MLWEVQHMRILIVDDHTLFRKGLVALLQSDPRFREVADVSSAPEAIEWLSTHSADLVTVDLSLEKGSGLDLLAAMQQMDPAQRTVVLTMFNHRVLEQKARALGTGDFITKDVAPKVLRERLVAAVHPPFFSASKAPGNSDPIASLSPRQLDIFRLMGRGHTTQEIADLLLVSPKTVESHRRRLKEVLNVKNMSQLIALAAREFPEG
jgi:DNA-binding NarL/FixJ family response regulator